MVVDDPDPRRQWGYGEAFGREKAPRVKREDRAHPPSDFGRRQSNNDPLMLSEAPPSTFSWKDEGYHSMVSMSTQLVLVSIVSFVIW